jgi:hypothetical protein
MRAIASGWSSRLTFIPLSLSLILLMENYNACKASPSRNRGAASSQPPGQSGAENPNHGEEIHRASLQRNSSMPTDHSLRERQCQTSGDAPLLAQDYKRDACYPTYDDIVRQIRQVGLVGTDNTPLFYSNLGESRNEIMALGLRYLNQVAGVPRPVQFDDVLPTTWLDATKDDIENVMQQSYRPFVVCASQALAAETRAHEAYVALLPGMHPKPDSVWVQTEFPALTQNPHVHFIYSLDPTDSGSPAIRTLWERGVDAEMPLLESWKDYRHLMTNPSAPNAGSLDSKR